MGTITKTYNKRIYKSPREFFAAIKDMLFHLGDIKAAVRSGRIDHAFAEKIMLAVTQVNDCRYCNYAHTKAALKHGVSENEIALIKTGELSQFPEEQAVALYFGQHYAETNGHPDPQAWENVVEYYGQQKANDIISFIRMITKGNLFGNTIESFLYRVKGRFPSPN